MKNTRFVTAVLLAVGGAALVANEGRWRIDQLPLDVIARTYGVHLTPKDLDRVTPTSCASTTDDCSALGSGTAVADAPLSGTRGRVDSGLLTSVTGPPPTSSFARRTRALKPSERSCHRPPSDLWSTNSVGGDLAARSDSSASDASVVSGMYRSW